MNKSAESRTRQFEAASADFGAVISTERRNLTGLKTYLNGLIHQPLKRIKDVPLLFSAVISTVRRNLTHSNAILTAAESAPRRRRNLTGLKTYLNGLIHQPLKRIKDVLFLFNRMLFFFSVLMKSNRSKNQSSNYSSKKNNGELIHFYAPLSSDVPIVKNKKKPVIPQIKEFMDIFSGVANFPMISAIKIAWLKFKKTFATFSLCFLVNLIRETLLKVKIFVNPVTQLCLSYEVNPRYISPFLMGRIKEGGLSPLLLHQSGTSPFDRGIIHIRSLTNMVGGHRKKDMDINSETSNGVNVDLKRIGTVPIGNQLLEPPPVPPQRKIGF